MAALPVKLGKEHVSSMGAEQAAARHLRTKDWVEKDNNLSNSSFPAVSQKMKGDETGGLVRVTGHRLYQYQLLTFLNIMQEDVLS